MKMKALKLTVKEITELQQSSFTKPARPRPFKVREEKMKYQIRFNHTSNKNAASMVQALQIVRSEARVSRLHKATVPDGTFCYRTKEDMDRDDTGARAYAVICKSENE